MKRNGGLNQSLVASLVMLTLLVTALVVILSQIIAEKDAFQIPAAEIDIDKTEENELKTKKIQQEIFKLAAEIRKIRSDTSGSLFWLKLIAVFVTVGGAVGGYLMGQSTTTRKRLEFEDRKKIDAEFKAITKELSDQSPLLRTAAAVKFGMILKSFPVEWSVTADRRKQLIQLSKQILAASLALEDDVKVLKTLTISLVLHPPSKKRDTSAGRANDEVTAQESGEPPSLEGHADVKELDLSNAKADDAYWACADFSYTDFYKAHLNKASFRHAVLLSCQFREAILKDAVLANAHCKGANFKMSDLRGADFSQADLRGVNFENAKVYGAIVKNASIGENPDGEVDISPRGNGSKEIAISKWLSNAVSTSPKTVRGNTNGK